MVELANQFHSLQSLPILVMGDLMLDTYITGTVSRISPEAPVPILEVINQSSRPGGAGNVALNLQALGAEVFIAGRVGADREGDLLRASLQRGSAFLEMLFVDATYQTPVKKRLIAGSQHLLRVDLETKQTLSVEEEEDFLTRLDEVLPRVKGIALSDYGKGFLTDRLIHETIQRATSLQIPIVVDPKGQDFSKYTGATLLKPNLFEAYSAVKGDPYRDSLDLIASRLFLMAPVKWLLITRSEAGMSLFNQEGIRKDFPVRVREVKDVTGAGDTALAMIILALANQLELSVAIQLANIASAIAVERIGCAQITAKEISHRLGRKASQ